MRRIDLPDFPPLLDDLNARGMRLLCRRLHNGWVLALGLCFSLAISPALLADQLATPPEVEVAENKKVPPFDPVEESFLPLAQPIASIPENLPVEFERDVSDEEWARDVIPVSNQSTATLQSAPAADFPAAGNMTKLPVPPAPETGKSTATSAPENPNFPVPWAGNDRPVVALKASIALPPGEIPRNRARELASTLPTQVMVTGVSRPWLWQEVEWEAAATRHLPLYFEEPMLERLGYTHGWGRETCDYCATDCDRKKAEAFQPFVSAAAFFGRVPILPYQMGVDLPWEPIYTLGEPLPGSPAPYEKRRIPWSLRGALFQAGATTGAVFIVP